MLIVTCFEQQDSFIRLQNSRSILTKLLIPLSKDREIQIPSGSLIDRVEINGHAQIFVSRVEATFHLLQPVCH